MTGILALSAGTLSGIVVVLVVDLFAVLFGLSFLRARRAQRAAEAEARAIVEPAAAPKAVKPVSRRDFLRRSLVTSLSLFGAQFGAATIAFLWPNLGGGFGSKIPAGKVADILAEIEQTGQPFYVGQGRFYLVKYTGKGKDPSFHVDYGAVGAAQAGLMPLYQKCPHLGCRVPFCEQSSWFECPCHGSKYNTAGEYQLGPAPRGMDRFRIEIDGDDVIVDTAQVILGPPRGTNTVGEDRKGAFCV
ncbi:MAG: ubiquinol-cytochrome c reductase iron-sulfur subunit [Actinomycetota bacterium]